MTKSKDIPETIENGHLEPKKIPKSAIPNCSLENGCIVVEDDVSEEQLKAIRTTD